MPPKTLQRINRDGNAFPYSTEPVDDWAPDGDSKDCDSYASWKMLRCLEAGIPSDHMAIATCWVNGDYEDGYHAVLLVYLDGKVWCLEIGPFGLSPLNSSSVTAHLETVRAMTSTVCPITCRS